MAHIKPFNTPMYRCLMKMAFYAVAGVITKQHYGGLSEDNVFTPKIRE